MSTLSTQGCYLSGTLWAVTQSDVTGSKSHQSSIPWPRVLAELGFFSDYPFMECDFKSIPKL